MRAAHQHAEFSELLPQTHIDVGGCRERGGTGKASEGSGLDPEPPSAETDFTVWVKTSHGVLGLPSVTPRKTQFPVPRDEVPLGLEIPLPK